MAVVLDAGALVAIERGERETMATIRVAQQRGLPVRASCAVVAQVWRDGARQVRLARMLAGVDERPLDETAAREAGRLAGLAGTADVVDAHCACMVADGDVVITSDVDDMRHLLDRRGIRAVLARI